MLICVFIIILFGLTKATVPKYLPSTSITNRTLLIIEYFLVRHGITTSFSTVKWLFKRFNLKRRNGIETPFEIVSDVINREIQTSGQCLGYRTIWRRLMLDYHMYVKGDNAMGIMRAIDPDGIEMRKAHRLCRRIFYAKG
jgi:hypothetical protein